jgi:hypothetical protein
VCLNVAPALLDCLPGLRTLLYDTLFTGVVTTAVQTTTNLSNPTDFVWSFRTRTPPQIQRAYATNAVVTVNPIEGEKDMPVTATFYVDFAFPAGVAASSLAGIKLLAGTAELATTKALSAPQSAEIKPNAPLAFSGSFTLLLPGGSSGLKDALGNYLPVDVRYRFSTGAQTTAVISPVSVVTPLSSASIFYSRPIHLPSATNASIVGFEPTSTQITGVVAQSASTPRAIVYTPNPTWRDNSTAKVVSLATVLDERGNPVAETPSNNWGETGAPASASLDPDGSFSVTPANNAVIGGNELITLAMPADFSPTEAVGRFLATSVSPATITLAARVPSSTCVDVPLDYTFERGANLTGGGGDKALMRPRSLTIIRAGCTYRLTVKVNKLPNLYGVASTLGDLVADYTVETTAPTIAAADITVRLATGATANLGTAATNVAGDTTVVAQFSEPMDPATTFSVKQGATDVPGAFASDPADRRRIVFTPSSLLQGGLTYTVTFTAAAAKDLVGNALGGTLPTGSFTVESTAPTFDSTAFIPAAQPDLPQGGFRLQFSEAVAPGSLDTFSASRTIKVTAQSTSAEIRGCATLDPSDPTRVIWAPADPLPSGAYVINVSGVTDLARNAAASTNRNETVP